MTVVVADTSLNYLILIEEIAVLPALYSRIVIPPEVLAELCAPEAPQPVSRWIASRPEWIDVRRADLRRADSRVLDIDPGERAAILLAQEDTNSLLLIDDAAGREEANRLGIRNTGTLGILRAAAIKGLIELPQALSKLASTNFRISERLIAALLAEDAQRSTRG